MIPSYRAEVLQPPHTDAHGHQHDVTMTVKLKYVYLFKVQCIVLVRVEWGTFQNTFVHFLKEKYKV